MQHAIRSSLEIIPLKNQKENPPAHRVCGRRGGITVAQQVTANCVMTSLAREEEAI